MNATEIKTQVLGTLQTRYTQAENTVYDFIYEHRTEIAHAKFTAIKYGKKAALVTARFTFTAALVAMTLVLMGIEKAVTWLDETLTYAEIGYSEEYETISMEKVEEVSKILNDLPPKHIQTIVEALQSYDWEGYEDEYSPLFVASMKADDLCTGDMCGMSDDDWALLAKDDLSDLDDDLNDIY